MARHSAIDSRELTLEDRVIEKGIKRCATVMKGGRRFSFSAIVVAGNGEGVVGYGFGKAKDVPSAVDKATKNARKNLTRVPLVNGTLPHTIMGRFGAARVLLKPASPGTGVIAGATVRAVIEMAGVRNVLTKSFGSNNPINLIKATFNGLQGLRTREHVAAVRGVELE